MVAEMPVEPQLLAQLLEVPVARVVELCTELAARVRSRRARLHARAGGRRLALPEPPRPGPLRGAVRARGPVGPPVRRRARDAGHRGLQAAGVPRPGGRHPRRQRRRRDAHAAAAGLHRRGRQGPGPGPGGRCSAPRPASSSASASTRSTSCRRWPSSCRVPTSSSTSRWACGHRPARPSASGSTRSRRRTPGGPPPISTPRTSSRVPAEGADESVEAHADGVRLQKVLAQAGLGSRRVCEDLIEQRRVRVNGEVADLGRRVDPEVDVVEVDGAQIGVRPGLVHYLLQQAGRRDHDGVGHARPPDRGRARAGRAPGVPGRPSRRRHRGPAPPHQRRRPHPPAHPPVLRRRQGVPRRGGGQSRTEAWSAGSARASSSTTASRPRPRSRVLGDHLLRITIHEGRNRQIRRMCEAVGTPVVRLVRTRIGPLTDRTLRPGEWRALTQDEVRALERATVGQHGRG